MRFYCFLRRASGEIASSRHTSLHPVRGRLVTEPASAAFVDLLVQGEPDRAEVARLLDAGVVVTARVFFHLSEKEKSGARELPEALADGCSLLRLAGGVDAPPSPRGSGSDWVVGVVREFLACDPLDPRDPIPRPLARGLHDGRFKDLADIVRREEWELLTVKGVGSRTVHGFKEWVSRRTGAMRGRLCLATVRGRIRPAAWTRRTADMVARVPRAAQQLELQHVDGLSCQLKARLLRHRVRRLGDLCFRKDTEIIGWRGFGKATLDRLHQAVARLERQCADEAGLDAPDLAYRLLLSRPLLARVRSAVRGLSSRWRGILRARVLSGAPRSNTQRQIAEELGISAGRVGGIEKAALHRLDPSARLAKLLDERLSIHVPPRGGTLALAELEATDDWFSGVAARPVLFGRLLDAFHSSYLARDGEVTARVAGLRGTRRRRPPRRDAPA